MDQATGAHARMAAARGVISAESLDSPTILPSDRVHLDVYRLATDAAGKVRFESLERLVDRIGLDLWETLTHVEVIAACVEEVRSGREGRG